MVLLLLQAPAVVYLMVVAPATKPVETTPAFVIDATPVVLQVPPAGLPASLNILLLQNVKPTPGVVGFTKLPGA